MFFSVPTCSEVSDEDGSVYTAYDIHLNGAAHSAVRYSQLHKLNEQILRRFDSSALAEFPPKKLFALSAHEKEERKTMLEVYLQTIGQQPEIAKSNLFVDFLIQSQKEFNKLNDTDSVKITVSQADGKKISVDITGSDYTPEVLRYTAATLGIDTKHHPFFALYLMKQETKKKSVVRRLQDMECPYLTLKSLDESHSIEIRKSYWDKKHDDQLMQHNVSLHMLYIESIRNMEDRWIKPSAETLKTLKQFKTAGLKEQFIKVVRSESMYGYMMLGSGTVDYPDQNSQEEVVVYGGAEKLKFVFKDGKTISLPVRRVKCWTLFTEKKDVLSLHFLVMKDVLQWINISTSSSNVILISMVLQSILDELVLLSKGQKLELTRVEASESYLPISNKERKLKEERKKRVPSFSSLQNQENELFMEGLNDDDL